MIESTHLLSQFVTIAVAHAVAVASPGPDYALIVRHSARFGRTSALAASGGIATGILFHTLLAVSGVSLLLLADPLATRILTWAAAAYLLYLASQALRSRPAATAGEQPSETSRGRSAYLQGLLTNGLNPKALLFFVTIFLVVQEVPTTVKLVFGLYMALATWGWFSLLTILLTRSRVRDWMQRYGHYLDWAAGVVLVILAVVLVVGR